MGRIPSLLPLEVKPGDAGSRHETPGRLRSKAAGEARRLSYATSAGDISSPRFALPGRGFSTSTGDEAGPSARHGSTAITRNDHAGGLHAHSHQLLAPPRPRASELSGSFGSTPSHSSHHLPSSDASSSSCSTGLPSSSNSSCNSSSSSSGNTCQYPCPSIGAPNPSAPNDALSSILPSASLSSLSSSSTVTFGPTTQPVIAHTAAAAASLSKHTQSLSGSALARIALSSCSQAEQELRELQDPSSGASSPCRGASSSQPPHGGLFGSVTPNLPPRLAHLGQPLPGLHSSSSGTHSPTMPSSRRQLLLMTPTPPAMPPPAGLAAALMSAPGRPRLQRPDYPGSSYPSACVSPVSLAAPSAGGPAAGLGAGSSAMSRSLAALLDHRSALPASHPAVLRPSGDGVRDARQWEGAAAAVVGATEAGARAGWTGLSSSGEGDGGSGVGSGRLPMRVSGNNGKCAAAAAGGGDQAGSREEQGQQRPQGDQRRKVQEGERQQEDGSRQAGEPVAGAGAGAGPDGDSGGGSSGSGGGGGGRRSLALLLHSMLPPGHDGPGGDGQERPAQAGQSGNGVAWSPAPRSSASSTAFASAASASAAAAAPRPGVTACAMRVVSELQTLDEYSLVAAAKQRQLAAQQTLGKHSMSRRALLGGCGRVGGLSTEHLGGGGGGSVGRSFHASRQTPADALLLDAGSSSSNNSSSVRITALPSPPDATAGASFSCGGGGGPERLSPERSARSLSSIAAVLRNQSQIRRDPGPMVVVVVPPEEGPGPDGDRHSPGGRTGGAEGTGGSTGGEADSTSGSFLPVLLSPRGAGGAGTGGRSVTSTGAPSPTAAGPGSVRIRSKAASEHGTGRGGEEGLEEGLAGAARPPTEAEAAVAAVRALVARFGTMDPDTRGPEMDEWDRALRERRRKLIEALQAANPAAYHEEAAAEAEAAYRSLSERAQFKLRKLLEEASTQEGPVRQLEAAVRELTSQRPFFLPPVVPKPKLERVVLAPPKVVKPSWNLDESLFAQRKKESESHELFDTEKIRNQQLNLDWRRVVAKARFRRMVARGDMGVKEDGQSLEEELVEVREELQRQGDFIRAAFCYYSMLSGGINASSSDMFQISANGWMAFCQDAGITSKGSGVSTMDAQNIFVAVNFEEESETAEADANDDDAMVRFEFLEGLVRVAFCKYIVPKRMTDASDALGALLEEVVSAPGLPLEARVDPNDFRRHRFYCPEVEEVVREYLDVLTGMFKLYKARDRSKYFWPEHFMAFLEANQLLGPATGLHRREAKLIYGWSQALITDELRRRQRAVSLTFWDFVEAVARLADMISPPDTEEMIHFFLMSGQEPPELDRLVFEYFKAVGDAGPLLRRPSAGLTCPESARPLAPKLRLLLEYLVTSLREAWGGADAREVAAKVLRTASYLSGGIEMG